MSTIHEKSPVLQQWFSKKLFLKLNFHQKPWWTVRFDFNFTKNFIHVKDSGNFVLFLSSLIFSFNFKTRVTNVGERNTLSISLTWFTSQMEIFGSILLLFWPIATISHPRAFSNLSRNSRKWSAIYVSSYAAQAIANMFELLFLRFFFAYAKLFSHDHKQHKTSDINRAQCFLSFFASSMNAKMESAGRFSFQFQINCRMVMCSPDYSGKTTFSFSPLRL